MKWRLGVVLFCLPFCFPPPARCQQAVDCRWGPFVEWSECDGCTKTQVRVRPVELYAQYGGAPCSGEAFQKQPCVPLTGCPLETGCGARFRCSSGQCISQSLVCNGDQDCADGLDERACDVDSRHDVCDTDKTPPNSDFTGRGYDVLTGELKAGVINTLSFGGQCRKVFSGDHRTLFRLPQSILRYNFEVLLEKDDSDEWYESSWAYVKHLEDHALWGHDRRTFHTELHKQKSHRLLVLKSQVELAQFQNSAPQYLPLAEGFWKALSLMPLSYQYSAYRSLLHTYGSHFLTQGSLGGRYQALLEFDLDALRETSTTDIEWQRCWRKVKRRFFRKKVTTVCEKLTKSLISSNAYHNTRLPIKTQVLGGSPSLIAALSVLEVENPERNGESYDRWAASVRDFPQIINQKLSPLSELVKEVRCAGLIKLHLQTATEHYLSEQHTCHCQPCANNGQPLLRGTQCSCVCRPGTSGPTCQTGSVIGEPPGVIHGSWSCWSPWGSCSGGQRSRRRSCSNPAPRGGGRGCNGLDIQHKACEDPDLQYLKTMEPHCFGLSHKPPPACRDPPALENGYVQSPREVYGVGSRVQYSCVEGHYMSGEPVAECTDHQIWTRGHMECQIAVCRLPTLGSGVMATPTRVAYHIGDRVHLTCPSGKVLEGLSEIMCSSSLQWSPSPDARCAEGKAFWTSLQLCARLPSGSPRLFGRCQLEALQCLGRSFALAGASDCDWPNKEFTFCENCQSGEKCDESATKCVCRGPNECPQDSNHLCVTPGSGGVAVAMTECEVGSRRCSGEQVDVVSIDACQI
ncbi:complement component 7b [Aplochiton taeniatus]